MLRRVGEWVSASESGYEVSIVRIEFNSLLSLLTQLLLNRLQHVMVDGCWCNLITVVS